LQKQIALKDFEGLKQLNFPSILIKVLFMGNIRVFYDNKQFKIKNWRKIIKLLDRIIMKKNKRAEDINYVITTDQKLKEINIEFLKHNYYTDVIAFNYSEKNNVIGEIYISIDAVKRNSINYKVSLDCEMLRVIIHGILHLCGYNDKTNKEKKLMKEMEDTWINEYYVNN